MVKKVSPEVRKLFLEKTDGKIILPRKEVIRGMDKLAAFQEKEQLLDFVATRTCNGCA